MAENREYKSDVFSMLLEDPKNALEVYNGLNGPELELKCTVYNINTGMNAKLLQRCGVLKGYMYFVDKVRFYKEQYEDLTQAIEAAIDDCIDHHILEEFFRERRAEVVKVMQLDYTWERREKLIRAEEYEDGVEKGIETSFLQRIKINIKKQI